MPKAFRDNHRKMSLGIFDQFSYQKIENRSKASKEQHIFLQNTGYTELQNNKILFLFILGPRSAQGRQRVKY